MTRGNMYAYTTSHLVGRKMRELANTINNGNLKVLDGIGMPTRISSQKYYEDETNEARDVTVIEIGFPVQVQVCFYLQERKGKL